MKAVLALLAAVLVADVAVGQETKVVLAIEGWRSEARDGITYFRCASRICAAGSVVSYKRQPHRPTLTLADFEAHHRGLNEHNKARSNIRDCASSTSASAPSRAWASCRSAARSTGRAATPPSRSSAPDRPAEQLLARQRFARQGVDAQQLRRLPAPPPRHRPDQLTTAWPQTTGNRCADATSDSAFPCFRELANHGSRRTATGQEHFAGWGTSMKPWIGAALGGALGSAAAKRRLI